MKKNKRKSKNIYRKEGTKIFLRFIATLLIMSLVAGTVIFGMIFAYIAEVSKDDLAYDLRAAKMQLSSIIYTTDENGKTREYDKIYNTENRIWVNYDKIPNSMKDAMVAIEDKRFFEHRGVDWIRTCGAAFNVIIGKQSYGGSTLTQQLVKNLTEDNSVSFIRKIREIFRAINLEKEYSKDEILEAYLNVVNFGAGCRGVQAAANLYFEKDIKNCSAVQCAAIAGITQNPTYFNPLIHPENNKERREIVINEMHNQGKLNKEEFEKALKESENLKFTDMDLAVNKNKSAQHVWDWYTDAMLQEVIEDLCAKLKIGKRTAKDMLFTQGLKIYSAMDEKAQQAAESVINDTSLMPKDKKLELGYLMMDYNGRVLASIGSRSPKTDFFPFDRANFAKRQTGSSMKPLSVYAPAIDLGLYNFSSIIKDDPIPNFYGSGKPGPNNWYSGYKGDVTLQWAVENSSNAVAAHVLNKLTYTKSCEFLTKKIGITNLLEEDKVSGSSLAMGGLHNGLTLKEMTAGFQIFGNGGIYNKPFKYYYVVDRNNKILLDNRDKLGTRAIKETSAAIMNRLLRTVITNGTGRRANLPDWDVFGKTGTTNNDKDSWFIGGTPYATAGIWLGYDAPKRISGPGVASDIWRAIMSKYLSGKSSKNFAFPSDIVELQYCKSTGKLAVPGACSQTATGYFDKNSLPEVCSHGGVEATKKSYDHSSSSTQSESEQYESYPEERFFREPIDALPIEND